MSVVVTYTLGVKVWNMLMDFITGGTRDQVGQWMIKNDIFIFIFAKLFSCNKNDINNHRDDGKFLQWFSILEPNDLRTLHMVFHKIFTKFLQNFCETFAKFLQISQKIAKIS